MAGIKEAFEKFVTRVSSQEEPQDEYGDPQTGEKRIPIIQGIKRGYDFENRMPNIYGRRILDQVDLANGGVASMFRERPGYQEGGALSPSVIAPSGIEYELVTGKFSGKPVYRPKYNPSRSDIVYYEMDPKDFFEIVMATGVSTPTTTEIPTIDPFSGQPVSAQDQEVIENINKRLDYLKSLDPNYLVPGSAGGMVLEDAIAAQQETLNDILNKYTNQPTNFPTIDPFSGQQVSAQDQSSFVRVGGESPEDFLKENPGYIVSNILPDIGGVSYFEAYKPEVPTVDPFSGQQVSAQEQAAFTQPQQDIFPTLNVGSADPLTNILGSQVGNLSYSEMNALRNRPSDVLSANVGANLLQGLGTGLRDFAYVGDKLGTDYYKNLAGNFFENIKNLDKGFSYDPTYAGADKTGRLGYYTQGIKSLLGMNTPGSNVGGGTPGMRYAIEQISPYLSKTVGPVLNVLGSAPVTAFGILDTLTGSANAPEVGKSPEYFRQQLQLPENSPVSRFNQVQDPRAMMAYGGLTNTIPPVRGPSSQGVESLFTRRYN